MSDWKDKTDFEINAAVTCHLHNCYGWEVNDAEFYHCGIDGDGYFSQSILNYCNNPSDAWPIIIENNISTVFMCDDWECHALENGDEAFNTIDENALRAAMIVYLKINGVKP